MDVWIQSGSEVGSLELQIVEDKEVNMSKLEFRVLKTTKARDGIRKPDGCGALKGNHIYRLSLFVFAFFAVLRLDVSSQVPVSSPGILPSFWLNARGHSFVCRPRTTFQFLGFLSDLWWFLNSQEGKCCLSMQ